MDSKQLLSALVPCVMQVKMYHGRDCIIGPLYTLAHLYYEGTLTGLMLSVVRNDAAVLLIYVGEGSCL